VSNKEVATLGGGCFWCLEAVYQEMEGVHSAVSGYMGGHVADPDYNQVCSGTTGHAEVVQVEFDPAVTTFRDLLEVFFSIHDPTTLNRQGNDVGTQYRSVIFFHSRQQQDTANEIMAEMSNEGLWRDPIVTEVTPATLFYEAETYHQEYFVNNPYQPYCQYVVAPKVAKFRSKFTAKRKKTPVRP